jgi:hypothetical protein
MLILVPRLRMRERERERERERVCGLCFGFCDVAVKNALMKIWIWLQLKLLAKAAPCGGGVEYLHRDPASRRRRRKWKSQIRDSQIWTRVPRDSGQRKRALAKASSTYDRQIRPLVREGAPREQDRNCHTSNKDLVVSPKWVLCSKTDWPADRRY